MGSEWAVTTLKDAGVTLIDCVHKTPPPAGQGYPYIAIPQLKEGRIEFKADPRIISYEDYLEWTKKANPQPFDVVLSRRCNPGETAWVPEGAQFALGQNLVLLRSSGSSVYPPFLRWLVRGPHWWSQVQQYLNVGAVFDSLKCADIPNFTVHLPTWNEQIAIADLLGSLDDKIELNRQMNDTLEAMAQALFKSWFVDFDPVIDNALAAGNPIPDELQARASARQVLKDNDKQLPEAVRKQFPDRFVHSEELGWLPAGWSVTTVGEEIECVGGGTPSTTEPAYWVEGVHPFCTPKDMSTLRSLILTSTERRLTDLGVRKITSGLLNAQAVLMSSRAPIGYLAISDIPISVNQGVIAMIPNTRFCAMYLANWAQTNMARIKERANGSTFQEISKSNFRSIPFLIPAPNVLQSFTSESTILLSRLSALVHEGNVLISIRDAVLPKLLSGELKVAGARRKVEANL